MRAADDIRRTGLRLCAVMAGFFRASDVAVTVRKR
jgi:hypothetical protein